MTGHSYQQTQEVSLQALNSLKELFPLKIEANT